MQKVCRICFEIYKGTEPLMYCPKVNCVNDSELVEIDDILVDVIIKFWIAEIDTLASCGGHLYKDTFSPYITFFAHQFDESEMSEINKANLDNLIQTNGIFSMLNEKYGFDIGEIEMSRIGQGFEFRVGCNDKMITENLSAKEKLNIQNKFISFLYDVIEQLNSEE